jgi:hypothetical protein
MEDAALPIVEAGASEKSRHQTAKLAAQILTRKDAGFVVPTRKQKKDLLVAFAKQNLVIYGNAFDMLKLARPFSLNELSEIESNLGSITLYEIKSTNRPIGPDFRGYFFALTTAELLVAQNLKDRYRFVFVNTTTEEFIELTLTEVFGRAKGIYPTWSIRF